MIGVFVLVMGGAIGVASLLKMQFLYKFILNLSHAITDGILG